MKSLIVFQLLALNLTPALGFTSEPWRSMSRKGNLDKDSGSLSRRGIILLPRNTPPTNTHLRKRGGSPPTQFSRSSRSSQAPRRSSIGSAQTARSNSEDLPQGSPHGSPPTSAMHRLSLDSRQRPRRPPASGNQGKEKPLKKAPSSAPSSPEDAAVPAAAPTRNYNFRDPAQHPSAASRLKISPSSEDLARQNTRSGPDSPQDAVPFRQRVAEKEGTTRTPTPFSRARSAPVPNPGLRAAYQSPSSSPATVRSFMGSPQRLPHGQQEPEDQSQGRYSIDAARGASLPSPKSSGDFGSESLGVQEQQQQRQRQSGESQGHAQDQSQQQNPARSQKSATSPFSSAQGDPA